MQIINLLELNLLLVMYYKYKIYRNKFMGQGYYDLVKSFIIVIIFQLIRVMLKMFGKV